ncbi:hypothetical protein M2267_001032 [Ensifer sp. KUDG1]|uniref:hypothetical protein n=1 Tax=Ensifer sp. KUDG1 TaxID=3373919 RepID=UPI003D21731B
MFNIFKKEQIEKVENVPAGPLYDELSIDDGAFGYGHKADENKRKRIEKEYNDWYAATYPNVSPMSETELKWPNGGYVAILGVSREFGNMFPMYGDDVKFSALTRIKAQYPSAHKTIGLKVEYSGLGWITKTLRVHFTDATEAAAFKAEIEKFVIGGTA